MRPLPHILDTLARMQVLAGQLFPADVAAGHWPDLDDDRADSRPPFETRMFEMAALVGSWATCPRLSVGAALASAEGYVISTGYNGAPRGLPHCWDVDCLLDGSGRCKRAVHAEMNAINQAADRGVSIAGGTLYVTHQPCPECLVRLLNTKLEAVIYRHAYDHPTDIAGRLAAMVHQSPVLVCHWKGA